MSNTENEKDKLQSPLIVHKKTDASYQDNASEVDVDITHIETESATLERHRFKKEQKKSKTPVIIAVILLIAVAITAYLYFGKGIDFGIGKDETTTEEATTAYYTPEENKYDGIITVKGSYLFFEGEELNGIEDLISEIKYLDEGTSFIVQDEGADSTFLNEEVLTTLTNYNISYEVKYIISSGLISQYETTTAAPETETPAEESVADTADTQE